MDWMEGALSSSGDSGRPCELKSYILESEGGFPSGFSSDGITGEVLDTGLDGIGILRATKDGGRLEFFLDTGDPRFFVLHTNERSEDAASVVRALTGDRRHAVDNAWFCPDMLYGLAGREGNTLSGFEAGCGGAPPPEDGGGSGAGGLRMSVSGSLSRRVLDAVSREPDAGSAAALRMVRILRGRNPRSGFVQDDVTHDGRLSVKRGKSARDHLELVYSCRDEYSRAVARVEDFAIGTRTVGGKTLFAGGSLDFEFESPVEDLGRFIDRTFNSARPFRLWGLKSKVRDGYFRVMAVDLHTGAPINFEIADCLMRVYIYRGCSGGAILRLLANLQIHHDSRTSCRQIFGQGVWRAPPGASQSGTTNRSPYATRAGRRPAVSGANTHSPPR